MLIIFKQILLKPPFKWMGLVGHLRQKKRNILNTSICHTAPTINNETRSPSTTSTIINETLALAQFIPTNS